MSTIPSRIAAARCYIGGEPTPSIAEVSLPNVEFAATELRSFATAGTVETTDPADLQAMEATFQGRPFAGALRKLLKPGRTTDVDVRFSVADYDTEAGVTVQRPCRAVMKCQGKSSENPSVMGGQEDNSEVTVSVSYYKLVVGDDEVHELDPANFVAKVDGEDLLSDVRDNL